MLQNSIEPLLFMQEIPFTPSFLGDRNYIDISQISKEFFKHIAPFYDPRQLTHLHIQVSKPITHDGILRRLQKGEIGAQVTFHAYCGSEELLFGYFPGPNKILRRTAEAELNLADYVRVSEGVLHLERAFSHYPIYMLMTLGKATVLANRPNAIPKVASYYMPHYHLTNDQFVGMRMTMTPMSRSFAKLDMYLHEEYLGYVMVKI